MRRKPTWILPIFLAFLFSLGMVRSIAAQGNSLAAESNSVIQPGGQRDLVVQTSNTPPTSPEPSAVPVVISTPLPDGTVKHIIAGGQSLWALSEAYNVPFEQLLELNDLEPDAIVIPGNEVIIAPSYTPTSTPIGEPSATLPPRYSHTPSLGTPQATSQSFSPATSVPTETPKIEPRFRSSVKNPLVVISAVVISGGSLAAALYFSLRERD